MKCCLSIFACLFLVPGPVFLFFPFPFPLLIKTQGIEPGGYLSSNQFSRCPTSGLDHKVEEGENRETCNL